MPEKKFTHIKDEAPEKVLQRILASTCASAATFTYRTCSTGEVNWIVRTLSCVPALYFLECYQIVKTRTGAKYRGWSEEEFIPFSSCPLDLLALANGGMNLDWRASLFMQMSMQDLPDNVWLHSVDGFQETNSAKLHPYARLKGGRLYGPEGTLLEVCPAQLRQALLDGYGVAGGRC